MFLTTLRAEAWKIATVVALTFGVAQTLRIEGFMFIDGFKDEIQALHQVQIASAAKTQAAQTKTKEVALTHGDLNYAHKMAKARNPVDAYVADHRVRLGDSCGRPAQNDPAPIDHEPPEDAEYVTVSRNDFDIFVENSLKMQAVHEWGQELVEQKLAVPAPEFGSPPESWNTSPAAVEP